jgi:hypothetical protein
MTLPNLIFAKYVASIGFTTIIFQVLYQKLQNSSMAVGERKEIGLFV